MTSRPGPEPKSHYTPRHKGTPIDLAALPLDARSLARALIGMELLSRVGGLVTGGRIVETEAYEPGDPASHAFRGPTARNAVMFGPPHRAYVYRIYGRSLCFNVTCEAQGVGAGVLVRALSPNRGLATMRTRRNCERDRDLCRGPGRLTQALGIVHAHNGSGLDGSGEIWLAGATDAPGEIGQSVRIGLTRAAEVPLRYYERNCPYVSGPSRLSL